MKKIARIMTKVVMECMTVFFVFCCGGLVNALLWEFTDWSVWDVDEYGYMGFIAALGYVVIRYQARCRIKTYMEQINPKIERVAGMLNQIKESSEDKAA